MGVGCWVGLGWVGAVPVLRMARDHHISVLAVSWQQQPWKEGIALPGGGRATMPEASSSARNKAPQTLDVSNLVARIP